jgi:hypothetical protein
LSRPWNFSLLFFLFAFSPLPLFPFSLFLQPGNLEVRLGHVETREGLVTYGLPGRDG